MTNSNIKYLKYGSTPISTYPGDADFNAIERGYFEHDGNVGIATPSSIVSFDQKTGSICHLIDRKTGADFISSRAELPIFEFMLGFVESDKACAHTVSAQPVFLEDNQINIAQFVDTFNPKSYAVIFNEFHSSESGMVRLGVAADWWLELYINGECVYASKERAGNETNNFSPDNHVIEFPVKEGTNILAAKVISGSGGWRFVCGNPLKTQPGETVRECADLLNKQWLLFVDTLKDVDMSVIPQQLPGISPPERIKADQFTDVRTERKALGNVILSFSKHPVYPLSVSVEISSDPHGLIHMRIAIANRSEGVVSNIQFLKLQVPRELGGDNGAGGYLVAPSASGGFLVSSPWDKTIVVTGLYPITMNTQFVALYNDQAGLFVATFDSEGNYKKMSVSMEKGNDLRVGVEHLQPEVPGVDVSLTYDTVIGTYNGDWRDAADLYKQWAVQQPWCARTISEREDLPSYFTEGAALLAVPFLHEMPQYKLFPFEMIERLPEIADRYRQQTGLPHIGFAPFGWENRGCWAGINYFPARPSNEVWRKINRELKSGGNFTFMMPSGYKWVVKRQEIERMGPAFDDTSDFEARQEMLVRNADGTPWLLDVYDDTTHHSGVTAMLCQSSKEAQKTMYRIFMDIVELGSDLIQFDQMHGGCQQIPCYSKTHGHLPGYNKQYFHDFSKLCEKIRQDAKEICPEFGMSTESCGELAIPYMGTMWGRQCSEVGETQIGAESLAVFSYIYHEYMPVLGDGFSLGQGMRATLGSAELRCFRLAKVLTRGLIPTVYMEQVPLDPKNEWQEKVSRAFFSFCKPFARFQEYLIRGITRRPPAIECAEQEVWHYMADPYGQEQLSDGRRATKVTIQRPTVIAGTFEAEDGSFGTVIVNATPHLQQAKLMHAGKAFQSSLYRVDRALECEIDRDEAEISLQLEPFGVRMLISRTCANGDPGSAFRTSDHLSS